MFGRMQPLRETNESDIIRPDRCKRCQTRWAFGVLSGVFRDLLARRITYAEARKEYRDVVRGEKLVIE